MIVDEQHAQLARFARRAMAVALHAPTMPRPAPARIGEIASPGTSDRLASGQSLRAIEVSARSAAPAESVWTFLADVSTWRHWRSSFRACSPLAALVHRRPQAFITDTARRLAIAAQPRHPMRW